MGIDTRSISLRQDTSDRNLYWLSLKYSTKEKCKISVYYCATQIVNNEGMPTYFTIPDGLPSAGIVNVSKGISQDFEDEEQVCFDVEKYEGMPLFNYTINYYPCIISIEPRKKTEYGDDGVSDYQNLITYCVFTIDKSSNVLALKPIKQILIAFDMAFNLQQIYGISDALEDSKERTPLDFLGGNFAEDIESSQQCVICLSEEKNTVVMPCGHLCVCKDCATAISKQRAPDCPICRKKVKSFVPLNIQSIKKLESKTIARGQTLSKGAKAAKGDYEEGYQVE